jgi:hypothetical protein
MVTRIWARAPLGATLSGIAVAATLAAAMNCRAGIVALGGGWQAEWHDSLDGLVSVTPLNVTADTITISKSAVFQQGPVNGIFPSIPIVFRQIGESTISNIVIDSELISNNTGTGWSDFHFDLLAGGVTFNPTATANSGPSGFVVSPFTNAAFTPDNTRLDLDGGFVASGGLWTPGAGANGGALWINVVSGAPGQFKFFTLKETPTPGPSALAVIALGVVMYTPRRRRD